MNRNTLNAYDSAMLSDEGDLYSDDEDGSSYNGEMRNSLGEKIIPSAADRRAHHNALERKRRDHIKDSFTSLRDSVPSLQGEKVTASRAQILKKAAEYIQFMRKKNNNVQGDIDEIAKQNKRLEDQIRAMERDRHGSGGSRSSMTSAALSSIYAVEPTDGGSTSYDISENSNGSSTSGLSSSIVNASPVTATTVASSSSASSTLLAPKTNGGGSLLNGSIASSSNSISVRPVTVTKNGTSKIIVQNPQHKSTPHVIHVTAAPNINGNGGHLLTSNTTSGTPIIISASQLSSANGTSNGGNNYVLSKGAGAISLPNGLRTLVLQSAGTSTATTGATSATSSSANIHILGTIPATATYSKQQPPMKKLKISAPTEAASIIAPSSATNGNGITNVTSISSS